MKDAKVYQLNQASGKWPPTQIAKARVISVEQKAAKALCPDCLAPAYFVGKIS